MGVVVALRLLLPCDPPTLNGGGGGRQANMINGTEALSFRPNIKKHDTLYVFSDDIRRCVGFASNGRAAWARSAECSRPARWRYRSSALTIHTDNVKTKGIPTYRFRIEPSKRRTAEAHSMPTLPNILSPCSPYGQRHHGHEKLCL
jgi:hypothetical protein